MRKSWIYWLFVRIPFWFLMASILLVTLLRWVPVKYTPLMLKRSIQFRNDGNYHREQKWLSIDEMTPELINAVVICEDQKFWQHHGFDWLEMRTMWQMHKQEGTRLRGCSTISQQTAKNVFTFGSQTIFRKLFEAYWTCLIELIWGKKRIMEVYLNVAEMGKGIYGVEQASIFYFEEHASNISQKQAVSIAVCLHNPLKSNPVTPIAKDRMRRTEIMDKLEK